MTNKKTYIAVGVTVVVLVLVYFLFLNKTGSTSTSETKKTTEQVNGRTNVVNEEKAPENKTESEFNTADKNDGEFYISGARPTGVYKNGINGFNLNVNINDVVDNITGDWGVTKSGVYFCKKKLIEDKNSFKADVIKIAGYMTVDAKKKDWRWKPVTEEKVGDFTYYVYQNPTYKPGEIKGNIVFCYWYYKTNAFFPYVAVEKGDLPVASDDPLL